MAPKRRKPELAQRMNIQNAPQILQSILAHIQQHMSYLAGNQQGQQLTNAGSVPGEEQAPPSPAMGHAHPPPPPSPAAPANAPSQGQAMVAGTRMPGAPNAPSAPQMQPPPQ